MKDVGKIKDSGQYTRTNPDGPGILVSCVQKEDFDWLVERAEKAERYELIMKKAIKRLDTYETHESEEAVAEVIRMLETWLNK